MAKTNSYKIYVVFAHRDEHRYRYHNKTIMGCVARSADEVREHLVGGLYGTVDKICTVEKAKALNLTAEDRKRVESEIELAYKFNRDILETAEQ